MREVIAEIEAWLSADNPIALATVVKTWGSAPRKAGAKLALTQSGELRAFIESPEEAGMFPLPVSAPDDLKLTRFCTGPETMSFWAMTDSGKLANVRAEITDDAAIALTVVATEKPPAKIQICSALPDGTVYAAARTKKRASLHMMSADGWSGLSGFPALSHAAASKHGETVLIAGLDSLEQKIILSSDGAAPKRVEVQPGLSIGGLDTASFVTATNISMGSVFNQGIIVAGDAAESRLVFIALPYAARTLAEP